MTTQVPQKAINDVLKVSLEKVADLADKEGQLDEGMAGYIAGYLDCIRAKVQEEKK